EVNESDGDERESDEQTLLPPLDEIVLGVVKDAQHLDTQSLGAPRPAEPEEVERTDDADTGDHRGGDAGDQCDRETTNRSGAPLIQHGSGQDGRDVGVDDRWHRMPEAFIDGCSNGLPAIELLSNALEDQHVRVDRDTDGEDESGESRQREYRV